MWDSALITVVSIAAAKPTAAVSANVVVLQQSTADPHTTFGGGRAASTYNVRSCMHDTNFALQFAIDLAPLPPNHLGEPGTSFAVCASIIHSAISR